MPRPGAAVSVARMVRVLVVDDHADSRDLIAFMLTSGGHEVRVAADADEALALVRRESFDLGVIDIFMPVRDGISLIGDIRREYPHVKLVATSAGWDASGKTASQWSLEVLARARAAGAEGALPKPLIREALLALVDGLVDGAPLAQR